MIAFLIHEGAQVRVITPYHADFVADLKQIPFHAKDFDREQKCWFVNDDYSELLEEIAARHFMVQWCVTEDEADRRVNAARASAQRQASTPPVSSTHTRVSQCLDMVRRIYQEESELGLMPPVSSEHLIRAVYRARALMVHPDIAGAASTQDMVRLNRAYDALLKRCKEKAS